MTAIIINRFVEACRTGRALRVSYDDVQRTPSLSMGGLGLLSRYELWPTALRALVEGGFVHPKSRQRFLKLWVRVPWNDTRGRVADDDLFFAALRLLLPPYEAGLGLRLYRGQRRGYLVGPSWTRSSPIARKFALYGDANVGITNPLNIRTHIRAREDGIILTSEAPAEAIISAPCLLGEAEGEYIIDPRGLQIDVIEPF